MDNEAEPSTAYALFVLVRTALTILFVLGLFGYVAIIGAVDLLSRLSWALSFFEIW